MSAQTDWLSAMVREHILPGFTDEVFHSHPTLDWLWKNRDPLDGGLTIDWSFFMDDDEQAQTYSPFEDFIVSPPDFARRASVVWADYVMPFILSKNILLKTAGKDAVLRYMFETKDNRQRSFMNTLAKNIFGDGTQYAHPKFAGKMITPMIGLDKIVGADRTYGGFDSTTYPNLDSYVINGNDTTFSHLYDPSDAQYLPDLMAEAMNETDYGNGEVNFWAMPIILHEGLERAAMRGDIRLNWTGGAAALKGLGAVGPNGAGDAQLGVNRVFFRGVEVAKDRDCPAGKAFGLNSSSIQLKTLKGADMTYHDFVEDPTGDGIVANWTLSCQLVAREPRALAKIYGLATARS
jgi:hypothetical protein